MSAPSGQQAPTLWHVCDAWLRRATVVIAESADALNAMNVFPVSDADTGSNLRLTMAGIAQAVPPLSATSAVSPPQLDALVQAAILSAHGNSGAIVAEMFTSVCRSLEHDHPALRSLGAGTLVAVLLRTVATAARRAVARPVAGTILTVADDAATAAEQAATDHGDDALAVATAAQTGAREALARTPDQLAVLADAGVVDSGGQAYTLLVDVLVEVLGGPLAQSLVVDGSTPTRVPIRLQVPEEYEVMYVLRGAGVATLDALRLTLSEVGHSVVVVGDQAMAQVHVHLRDAGAAIEAALGQAELSQIRITALPGDSATAERSVISVVAGPGLAEAVTALGGLALLAQDGQVSAARLQAALDETWGDVVILPNDPATLEIAGHLAAQLRGTGRRVAVIPTLAQVQGLAAMAVHEPTADFESVVVAMSSAAGHARYGAVTVAEVPAMTMAGRCEAGDVLGAVDGDFVAIGTSAVEVAWAVVQRLLATGGELLTLVTGADAPDGLVADLGDRVRGLTRTVDVEVVAGGQPRYLLLIGLE
ncbi:MAG TPA: DAK2 domain-containing protein [Propionibacteriaceae bacterium]